MLDWLLTINRRVIFLLIGISVVLPALTKIKFPVTRISESTQALYDAIEGFEAESVVMISLDYGPSSMAELQPQLVALLHHCFARNLKVIGITPFIFEAVPLGMKEFELIAQKHNKQYGVDYCYLGYKPGGISVILDLGKAISKAYPNDASGRPLADIPLMQRVKNYDHIDLVISLASFGAPELWVKFVNARFQEQPIATGVTGVMVSDLFPYLDSKQLVGLLPGLKGAAEYEKLIRDAGYTSDFGQGAPGMSIQSIAHIVLILLIIFCNAVYLVTRRREG